MEQILDLLRIALQSRVRRLVLSTLKNSGASLSISEIGRHAGLSPSEVAGVIRGVKGQYEPQYSLLRLQLVSESISKVAGSRQQKTYKFICKNPILLNYIERSSRKISESRRELTKSCMHARLTLNRNAVPQLIMQLCIQL